MVGQGGGVNVGQGVQSGKQLSSMSVVAVTIPRAQDIHSTADSPSIHQTAFIDIVGTHGNGAAITRRLLCRFWRILRALCWIGRPDDSICGQRSIDITRRRSWTLLRLTSVVAPTKHVLLASIIQEIDCSPRMGIYTLPIRPRTR